MNAFDLYRHSPMRKRCTILFLLTMLSFKAHLCAEEAVFQNGKDEYTGTRDGILQGDPESGRTLNLWSKPVLDIGGVPWGGLQKMALMRFDDLVGNGKNQIPPRSSVQSARLELYKVGEPSDLGQYDAENKENLRIKIYAMLSHFEPGDIESENAPGISCFSYRVYNDALSTYWGKKNQLESGPVAGVDYDEAFVGSIPLEPGTNDQWYSVDLSLLVQDWVNGDHPAEGLYFCAQGYWIGANFASGDNPDPEIRPRLVIEWTPPAPTSHAGL